MLTDTEIIIAIAKLDGWVEAEGDFYKEFKDRRKIVSLALMEKYCGSYLTSRDAIIPVIEKLIIDSNSEVTSSKISSILYNDGVSYSFRATPRQLCIALLKATNNWKEQ